MRRPKVWIRHYIWKATDGTETAGIAVQQRGRTIAHYTADEAFTMANKLVDLAEQLEQQHQGETA